MFNISNINLDRFSDNSIKDAQDKLVYAHCDYCRSEIYLYEPYLRTIGGHILEDKLECVIGYYQLFREWAGDE